MKAIMQVPTLKDYIKCLNDKANTLKIGIVTAAGRGWDDTQVIQAEVEHSTLLTIADDLQLLLDKPLRATYWKKVN